MYWRALLYLSLYSARAWLQPTEGRRWAAGPARADRGIRLEGAAPFVEPLEPRAGWDLSLRLNDVDDVDLFEYEYM